MTADRTRRSSQRVRRGFTLVELIVSLTAGLLIAAAAFLLARNASTFFQREAGITAAQFASVMGMTRLQSDLRRAAFMSSPRPDIDPLRCGDTANWPQGLKDLAGVVIENGGSVARHGADHDLSAENGLTPDAIILGGSFSTTEQYAVDVLSSGSGGGLLIQLQNDGAMWRTRLAAQNDDATLETKMLSIFRVGGFIRIVDDEGRSGYGVVTGVDATGQKVQISVSATPTLPTRNSETVCGCQGFCTGALVNPVSRVLYDLRRINPAQFPAYAALYQKGYHDVAAYHRGAPEVARTELVRVELDALGDEIANTLELIAEYAVDLKLGVTAEVPQNPPTPVPVLERYPIGHPQVYTLAAPIAAGGTPERIRALQVRLSVRNADRDRDQALTLPNPPPDGGLFRYSLGQDRGFARLRTLITDVALSNQTRMP
jgi:prepilin-type N-terminal cleavage/methylation domain-containing protein